MDFDLDAYLADAAGRVNRTLDSLVPAADTPPAPLHAAIRHSLFAGGKRLRPVLCLAAADTVRPGAAERVLPAACALEMIHTFSLIHDDLPALDNDDLRRGVPTCHVAFGEDIAILAGDALHTMAFSVLSGRQEGGADAILSCVRLLADACGTEGMVGGQVDDLLSEGQPLTPDALASIHARKTGALLRASVLSGAILAGADAPQIDALDRYARQVGIAFQIVDDILDVTADDATLGKPAGSDLRHDKATYPKFFGIDGARRLADAALADALDALTSFGPRADALRALARFSVQRSA